MLIATRNFIEEAMSGRSLQVDSKLGVIRNVKVLGLLSVNGRKYLPEAVKLAARLYEGVRVNIDHPKEDPGDQRSAYDRFGRLTNIRYVPNEGLYGDLEYLTKHPMASRIVEAALRMPDAFGLSHNAQGEGEEDLEGIFVVRKITEVRHVDLVADPATTKSLKESVSPKNRRVKMKESSVERKQLSSMSKSRLLELLWDQYSQGLKKTDYDKINAKRKEFVNKYNGMPKEKLVDELSGGPKMKESSMAGNFNNYDKWKDACNSKYPGCKFERQDNHVICSDKSGKKVGFFKPSSTFNSGGKASPPGKGQLESIKRRRTMAGKSLIEGDLMIKHMKDCIEREDLDADEKVSRVMELYNLGTKKANVKATEGEEETEEDEDTEEDAMTGGPDDKIHIDVNSHKGEDDDKMEGESDGIMPDDFKEGDGTLPDEYKEGDDMDEDEKEKDAMEGDEETEEDEDAEKDEDEDEDEDSMKESRKFKNNRQLKALKEEIGAMKREARVRRLCEAVRLPLTKALLSDLMALPAASLERHAKRLAEAHHTRKPKSYGPGLMEGRSEKLPSGEELFNWLRS